MIKDTITNLVIYYIKLGSNLIMDYGGIPIQIEELYIAPQFFITPQFFQFIFFP